MESRMFTFIKNTTPSLVVITLLLFGLLENIKKSESFLTDPTNILILVAIAVTLGLNTFNYLESGNGKASNKNLEYELGEIKSLLRNKRFKQESDINQKILEEILKFRNEFLDTKTKELELSPNDKNKLFDILEEKLEKNLSSQFLYSIDSKYGEEIVNSEKIQSLLNETSKIKDRISFEIRKLSTRANINLAIGSITTLVAVFVLYVTVTYESVNFLNYLSLVSHFIPRISLVIFIEIFAFFFLKLYKSNLENIRYFHNELTNIEMKLISLNASIIATEKDTLNNVINELTKTERNFILKKDESTIELEKSKNDNNQSNKIIDTVKDIISSFNKTK